MSLYMTENGVLCEIDAQTTIYATSHLLVLSNNNTYISNFLLGLTDIVYHVHIELEGGGVSCACGCLFAFITYEVRTSVGGSGWFWACLIDEIGGRIRSGSGWESRCQAGE